MGLKFDLQYIFNLKLSWISIKTGQNYANYEMFLAQLYLFSKYTVHIHNVSKICMPTSRRQLFVLY